MLGLFNKSISNEELFAMIVDTLTVIRTVCKSNDSQYDSELEFLTRWVELKCKFEKIKLSRAQRIYIEQIVFICVQEVNLRVIRRIVDGLVVASDVRDSMLGRAMRNELNNIFTANNVNWKHIG